MNGTTNNFPNENKTFENDVIGKIPGSIAFYRLKKDGRIEAEYLSAGFSKLLGYSDSEELMAKSHFNFLEELPTNDAKIVLDDIKRAIANKTSVSSMFNIYTKKHNIRLVRFEATVETKNIENDDIALLYGIHTIVSDESLAIINEQKRARNIFDILKIAYWEWNINEGYYHSSQYDNYAISKIKPEEIWDNDVAMKFVHPEDIPLMKSFMTQDKMDEIKTSAIIRVLMVDGTYRWTEMFSFAEETEDKKPVRIVTIMRDVDKTWLEQKEQLEKTVIEVQKANKAKTDFLSRVSHDMRTPLNGILGLTSLIKENVTDENIINDLQQLEMSGNYLLNLINDTLDVSRIESGRLELHPIVCDGRSVFNNVIALLKPNLQSKNITLRVNAPNLPFTILFIDVGRVEQVIMNILGNAIKFTPEGGTIDLSLTNLSVDNNLIVDKVVVKDSGIGMSPEFLPHLFEPFSQENSGTTSMFQGTGLGMTITKQIISIMGGEINVESELGKGTTFTFTLPMPVATEEQVTEWKKSKPTETSDHILSGKRILLCEDHPLNATIAKRLLSSKGVIVEHATNGLMGFEMFEKSQIGYYNLILMDIRMPIMDGIESTKKIRALQREDAKIIPIIAMTANAFEDDIKQTKEAGMNAHLGKPIETQKLYSKLEELLDLSNSIKKPIVLIVDDISINREVVKAALGNAYILLEAENGKEALEVLNINKGVDVVVTDIQMPVMNGIDLIRNIRADSKFKHIAIIANTQFGDPQQEEVLLAIGANDFVYKPTTSKILEIRIRNALRRL